MVAFIFFYVNRSTLPNKRFPSYLGSGKGDYISLYSNDRTQKIKGGRKEEKEGGRNEVILFKRIHSHFKDLLL